MINQKFLKQRLNSIQTHLIDMSIKGYLVSSPANCQYLTGLNAISHFHREVFCLMTPKEAWIFHSPLIEMPAYLKQLFRISPISSRNPLSRILADIFPANAKVIADMSNLTASEYLSMQQNAQVNLIPSQGIIENRRFFKDRFEIEQLTKACQIAAKTWHSIMPQIKPSMTEKFVQTLILNTLRELGSDQFSGEFLPIVAAGSHSAIPHHVSSDNQINSDDVVLVDFGCQINGYWSDMTRTIKLGKPDQLLTKIEYTVQKAYKYAIKAMNKNFNNQDPDRQVMKVLENAAFGTLMPHTTGHGIGLEVHEMPTISRFAEPKTIENRTVFTIEPGIYIKGKFGYRYENTLIRENNVVRELTGLG